MACVYCGRTDDLTEEHVFPDALGGRSTVADMVCRACNSRFSAEFEQDFVRGLSLIRFLLRVPTRRGRVEKLSAETVVDGAVRPAKVLADGEISVPTFRIEEEEKDGERRIIYKTFSKEAQDALLEAAKKKGLELTEGAALLSEIEAVVELDLRFVVSVEAYRTVAKIAYTGYAQRAGRQSAESAGFQPLRDFIAQGEGPSPVRLFLNRKFAAHFNAGPHQHALVLGCNGQTHLAHAIVVIFGGLYYLVNLTDQCFVDVFQSYGCNCQAGSEDRVLVGHLENERLMIEEVLHGNTIWDDYSQSLDYLVPFWCNKLGLTIRPDPQDEYAKTFRQERKSES